MTLRPEHAMWIQAVQSRAVGMLDPVNGSLDGEGAGDHDAPFTFGRRPRAATPYPFSARQYARLLLLRGRVLDQSGGAGHSRT